MFKPVSALERGLLVLAAVSKFGRVRVADVQGETSLDKATIIRMLETLVHLGYVEKHLDDRTYDLTGRIVDLSRGFGAHMRLADLASPVLQEFRSKIGWPADFAVPDGDAMFIVETGKEESGLLSLRPTNYRPHLFFSAIGLAYSAFCSPEEQGRLLERVAGNPTNGQEIQRTPAQFQKRFKQVRATGYADTDPQYLKMMGSETIHAIAVPVADGQRIYGSIGVFFVRSAVTDDEIVERYLPPLRDVSVELMQILDMEKSAFPSAPFFFAQAPV